MGLSAGMEDIDIAVETWTKASMASGVDESIRVGVEVEVQSVIDDIDHTGIENERIYDSHESTRIMIDTSMFAANISLWHLHYLITLSF